MSGTALAGQSPQLTPLQEFGQSAQAGAGAQPAFSPMAPMAPYGQQSSAGNVATMAGQAPAPAAGNPGFGNIQSGFNGMDIGSLGRTALGAAGYVPGPLGMIASLASLGLHGYNLSQTDQALNESGLPSLGAMQTIGAMMGLNGYANGSNQGLQGAIAAQGGNTQSPGSPGFSIGAASGGDVTGATVGGFSPGAASGADTPGPGAGAAGPAGPPGTAGAPGSGGNGSNTD